MSREQVGFRSIQTRLRCKELSALQSSTLFSKCLPHANRAQGTEAPTRESLGFALQCAHTSLGHQTGACGITDGKAGLEGASKGSPTLPPPLQRGN